MIGTVHQLAGIQANSYLEANEEEYPFADHMISSSFISGDPELYKIYRERLWNNLLIVKENAPRTFSGFFGFTPPTKDRAIRFFKIHLSHIRLPQIEHIKSSLIFI